MSEIRITRPTVQDAILRTAHGTVFPFVKIKLERSTSVQTFDVTIKLGTKLYDFVTRAFGASELISYLNLEGDIGIWRKDMTLVIGILGDLKIMHDSKNWILDARDAVSNLLSGNKIENVRKSPEALSALEEILSATGLLEEIRNKKYLFGIAKDVVSSKDKDPDTIIYRLAMGLYHAENFSGVNAIQGLEDLSGLYLTLLGNEVFVSKYKGIVDRLSILNPDERIQVIRTFICFIIGAYLYYTVVQ